MLSKLPIQCVQIGPDRMMQGAVLDRIVGRLRRPAQDFVNGSKLVADVVLLEIVAQSDSTELEQLGGRFTATRDRQRRLCSNR